MNYAAGIGNFTEESRLRAFTICLLTILLSIATLASANPLPREVKIAVINDVPSTILGIALMDQAYTRLGIEMQIQSLPSRRALHLTNRGELDGDLFRIKAAADSYPNLIWVDYPLLEGGLYAVFKDPDATELPNTRDKPLQVAVRRGVLIAEQTAQALGMHTVRADSYDQIRNLLEHGRADFALISNIEGLSPMTGSAWEQMNILPEPVTRFTLYHYLNKRHAHLAEALAEVLAQMEKEGVKQGLLEHALVSE